MRHRIVVCAAAFGAAAVFGAAANLIAAAPAHADELPCQYGEYVTADCPVGGCADDEVSGIDTLCGPAPLFPQGPQVNVRLRGGVGIGI